MTRIITLIILLAGCTSISDYYSKFRISGEVTAGKSKYFSIGVIDLNMDDTRNDSQRVILGSQQETGRNFVVDKSYFWGSSKYSAYKRAEIKISISSHGCKTWQKEFLIHEYYTHEKIVSIDLGEVTLQCESKN